MDITTTQPELDMTATPIEIEGDDDYPVHRCPSCAKLIVGEYPSCPYCGQVWMTPGEWDGTEPSVTIKNIEQAVAAVDFGRANAQKRGRNPKWPYVPVIIHSNEDRPGTTQEQIVKRAFEKRDEAIAHAQTVIDQRRSDLIEKLARPNHRALREYHGLPRDLAALLGTTADEQTR